MNLASYALSVTAVVIISVVAELLIPPGRSGKAARIVFSLIVTLTVLSPIKNIISGEPNIFSGFDEYTFDVDDDFVSEIFNTGKNNYKNEIFNLLKNSDFEEVTDVDCELDKESKLLKKVTVFYENNGISEAVEHTLINEVKSAVSNAFGVPKEAITLCVGKKEQ